MVTAAALAPETADVLHVNNILKVTVHLWMGQILDKTGVISRTNLIISPHINIHDIQHLHGEH